LIHDAVAPHIVKDTPRQAKLHKEVVDSEIADAMRGVLHDPRFQSVESTWRGLQWVVSNLELDENLQLHLFDVTREELLADIVAAQGEVAGTELYRALVDRWRNVPGEHGWSVIGTTHLFGPSDTDASLLAALGLLATQAGAPLIAGAEWILVTEQMPAPWRKLRESEVARSISLAAPRVLLRLPYGTRGEQIAEFPFEEFREEPEHEHLLWGSGALALSILIGRSFTARGWEMELGDEREIDDLPAYVFERDGEKQLQPSAEYFLTEREIQRALDAGMIPLVSRRDRNALVAVRFQTITT
jgi:type VI secretion system protein ImpC